MARQASDGKPTKRQLRDALDRELGRENKVFSMPQQGMFADRKYGVYSVDPNAPTSAKKKAPPRNVNSVEPGAPAANLKVPVIPTASYDPIRAEGNWAPFRPVPEPIPGIVPGFNPGQPMMGEAQWGGTGTPITAGFLTDLGEYNPEVYGRSAVQVYEKMRRSDAQVWATLSALKSPLRSARWDIRPGIGPDKPGYEKAKEVSEFVKENIFGGLEFQTSTGGMTTQSWDEILWNALLHLDFGCSIHENVFRVDGNYLKLRAMVPLLPITYYRWHVESDGHTLIALEQYGYRGIEFINATIPAEKLCRFTLHQEGANFWGIALSRSMYPHWYIKALALDTMVPGPDGRKTIATLKVGDRIFDEQGKIRHVTGKSDVFKQRPCYRVTLSSGTSIIADAEHEWLTQTAVERGKNLAAKVRTTKEIYLSLKDPHQKNSKTQRSNHSIEPCYPVEYAEQLGLLIHPYVLGMWLGCGSKNAGSIASHKDTAPEKMDRLLGLGYKSRWIPNKHNHGGAIYVYGLSKQLRALSLLGRKHIPEMYMRGNIAQRRALVAGLMDTDGGYTDRECKFTNVNTDILSGLLELLRSLGEMPRFNQQHSAQIEINGWQTQWCVAFTTNTNPFWLSTKADKFVPQWKQNRRRHYIRSVEPIDPQDTQCITTDAPSHLFLVGDGFVATHNSSLYRVDAVAGERNGLGVPVITLPEGPSAQDVASANNFVTKVSAHELTGLVLPNGATFKFEGLSGQPRDIMKSIEHHNRMISTAAMAMFMTIGSAPHGSRATAATQHDFFLSSTHFLSNYISERLSQTTVKKLVHYNFGDDAVIPKIRAMNLKMRDFEDVRQSLQELAAADLVVSDLPLRNYIRAEYELAPETTEGVLISKKGESIENEPGGGDIATPTDVPDATGKSQPAKEAPAGKDKTKAGATTPKPDKGAPAQVGKTSPAQQPNQKQYGKPIKPVGGAKPKGKVNNVIQSSEVMLDGDSAGGGRLDQVIQDPDEDQQDLSETVESDEAYEPTIYFVRHGETEDDVNPDDQIISSWSEVGLTKKGQQEAQDTAKRLGKVDIGEIYAGDLPRTMQTADAISKATGVAVTPERGLRGWNVGAYTGLSSNTELNNGRTIKEQLKWLQEHPSIKPPQGDSWLSTDARINDAIAFCIRRAEQLKKPIVVVTHSRVINSLPSLSRGAIPQAVSEEKGAMLGQVAKATQDPESKDWSISYNTKKLSDVGYHSIGDDMPVSIPNNRSGQPTQRPVSKVPNPGPSTDEKEEAKPKDAASPAIGGTSPTPGRSGKTKKVKNVTSQQAEQGARIISGGQSVEAGTSFKPSASQERRIAPVPEELQPSDKQAEPLEPTPDKDSVVAPETFSEDDSEDAELMAERRKKGTPKTTHYETLHGVEAVRALRAQHQTSFENLLRHLTGSVKAKVIGSIARQAAKQNKAKVPASQQVFTIDPHLENLVMQEIQKIYDQSKVQVKTEVVKK